MDTAMRTIGRFGGRALAVVRELARRALAAETSAPPGLAAG